MKIIFGVCSPISLIIFYIKVCLCEAVYVFDFKENIDDEERLKDIEYYKFFATQRITQVEFVSETELLYENTKREGNLIVIITCYVIFKIFIKWMNYVG